MVLEIPEGVVALEGEVKVEEHEAVTTVFPAAVGFHVVVRPVGGAEEQLYGHVVGEFVDVKQLLQLIVGTGVVDSPAQLKDAVKHVAGAVHEPEILQHVQVVVVISVVRSHKLLVVWLTQVQHTAELAVHEFYHRQVRLQVHVNPGTLHDALKTGVHETAGVVFPGVVAAIANQQHLIADIRFLWEEHVVEVVQPVKLLAGFQFERAGTGTTGPSARHTDVHVLVEGHLTVGRDVGEIHRTVPVHVPVAWHIASVAADAVAALNVNAPHLVGEIALVTHDRDHGNRVVGAALDVRAGHGHTWQVAVLEQAAAQVGRLRDGELSVFALLTVVAVASTHC